MLRISKTKGSKGKRQRRKQYSAFLSICTIVYVSYGTDNMYWGVGLSSSEKLANPGIRAYF